MADKEKKVVEAEAKPQKAKKEKKKGKIGNAWRGFKSEFLKIAWPSWAQVRKNSWVVLVVVVICAILIGAFDFAFSQGMRALTGIFA